MTIPWTGTAPAGDWFADWEVCQRVLKGRRPGRALTFAEKVVIFKAVTAGGGLRGNVMSLLSTNEKFYDKIAAHVAERGGVDGFPVVDGVTLFWHPKAGAE